MADDKTSQRIRGYCALCWSRCGCISTVESGRLTAVEADPDHVTGQALCVKGRAAPELVYHPDRLLYPMKRTHPKGDEDPGWTRIGWDEALDTIAGELTRLSDEAGSESVAFGIATPAATAIQDSYPWIERLRRAFGSPNAAIAQELCGFSRDMVFPHTFGVALPMPDHANAGCILLWGHNPSTTWLAHATRVADAKAHGAKLIVVDPRRVGFAVKADEWLRVRPGSDGALALGLAHVMISEGWFDRDFIQRWTNGPLLVRADNGRFITGADLEDGGDPTARLAWDTQREAPVRYDSGGGVYEREATDLAIAGEFEIPGRHGPVACRPAFSLYSDLCEEYTPERVADITWIPADQIRETAHLIGTSGPVSYYGWAGLEMHANASQTNRAIALLYALTGSFDVEGGNVVHNSVEVNDVTGTDLMSDEMLGKAIGIDERPLGPETMGWINSGALYSAILDSDPYPVRALVNFGKNLLYSHVDGARGAQALRSLEFMVQADVFMNPTAKLADVVLPICSPWEREGLCTDFTVDQAASAHAHLRPAVVEARGESRSDIWVAFALAERLGLGEHFWDGDVDAAYRHQLAPSGIALEELRETAGGMSLNLSSKYRKYADCADGIPAGFDTPSKKVEIYSEVFLDHGYSPLPVYVEPVIGPQAQSDEQARYPLVLTSGKTPNFLQSQSRGLPTLRRLEPDPLVEINPETAAERQIAEGDWVVLITPHGKFHARAHVSRHLHPKVVSAVHGWWQACDALSLHGYANDDRDSVNMNAAIGNDVVDPIGGSVPHKSYICQIERMAEAGN